MNRPSIYLYFIVILFLFCFGAADTIVDRVATESAIACQVKAFVQAHWLARTPKSWPLSCFGPGSAGVCLSARSQAKTGKKDSALAVSPYWTWTHGEHFEFFVLSMCSLYAVSVNGCVGLRVNGR